MSSDMRQEKDSVLLQTAGLRPKSKVGTASLLLVGVLINPSEASAFFDFPFWQSKNSEGFFLSLRF